MAAPADATLVSALVGAAEDVQDELYLIDPTETPVITNALVGDASAVYREWQEDTIGTATHNPKPEGDDPTATSTQPTRFGNYVQRNEQTARVSDTAETIRKYGRGSDLDREVANKMKLCKNEMETTACGTQGAVAGNTREAAGLGPMTHKANYLGGVDGSVAVVSSGAFTTGVTFPTADWQLKESDMLDVWETVWNNGGDVTMICANGTLKRKLSQASGVATQYRDNPAGTAGAIIGAMDVYVSDFGTASMVADRFMPSKTVYLLDMSLVCIDYLQGMQRKPLAKTGASEREMVDVEWTLRVNAPKGIGGLFGIDEAQDIVPLQ